VSKANDVLDSTRPAGVTRALAQYRERPEGNWLPLESAVNACRDAGGSHAEQRAAGASALSAQWGCRVAIVDRCFYWQIVRAAS